MTKFRKTFFALLLTLAACSETNGNWKMNAQKSTHNDGEPLPRRLIMSIEPHPEGEAVTVWRVTEDGRSETESLILRYDGEDHPHPQQELFESFNASKLPDGTAEVLYKKNGKVVAREIRQFAPRGREMTIQYSFISGTGTWLDRVLVFER